MHLVLRLLEKRDAACLLQRNCQALQNQVDSPSADFGTSFGASSTAQVCEIGLELCAEIHGVRGLTMILKQLQGSAFHFPIAMQRVLAG